MATLKEVQLKIQGVKKTKQITKAMNMVATSRLRGAQGAMDGFRPYAEKFSEVLGSLAEKAGDEASPLLIPKEDVKKIHIVLCTSDRGLCGGFNINLTDKAKKFIANNPIQGAEYSFTCFGKRARDWCRKSKQTITEEHIGVVGGKFGFNIASTAGKKLVDGFLAGEYDEVYLIYSEFVSMAKQLPTLQKLLPIPPIEKGEEEAGGDTEYLAEHICEPSAERYDR
jgi:F-type H+-transporting ATPase subunit gamma